MKQALAIAATGAVFLLVASPVGATANKGPTLKSLAAQVKALQKQVTTLKKRAATDESVIGLTLEYSVCSTAVTADAFQDTFTALAYGPQTPVNDYKACQDFEVVRAHNQSPPNTNILRALLDIFSARSFASHGIDLAGPARGLSAQFFALARGAGIG
jgi:hypothetical protein